MSVPMKITCTCSVCGKKSNRIVLASTNCFGPSDLDTRPPEMMRSTMRWWIQECPKCGYVSESLENTTTVSRRWLKSFKYLFTDGIIFVSSLAEKFYKYYLISIADGKTEKACSAAVHAAWACDDVDDTANAIICRKTALVQLDRLFSEDICIYEDEEIESLRLIRMDLLRRSEQFSKVIDEYSNVVFSSDEQNQIKEFQLTLAQREDTDRYLMSAVLPISDEEEE